MQRCTMHASSSAWPKARVFEARHAVRRRGVYPTNFSGWRAPCASRAPHPVVMQKRGGLPNREEESLFDA